MLSYSNSPLLDWNIEPSHLKATTIISALTRTSFAPTSFILGLVSKTQAISFSCWGFRKERKSKSWFTVLVAAHWRLTHLFYNKFFVELSVRSLAVVSLLSPYCLFCIRQTWQLKWITNGISASTHTHRATHNMGNKHIMQTKKCLDRKRADWLSVSHPLKNMPCWIRRSI